MSTRKVFVTNIPIRTCVSGWVEIPSDTEDDKLDDAIAIALASSGFQPEGNTNTIETATWDVDKDVLAKWEWCLPLEET